nr:hypothetical protein Iba_chr06bCG7380 [Ipomoea batatas]
MKSPSLSDAQAKTTRLRSASQKRSSVRKIGHEKTGGRYAEERPRDSQAAQRRHADRDEGRAHTGEDRTAADAVGGVGDIGRSIVSVSFRNLLHGFDRQVHDASSADVIRLWNKVPGLWGFDI